MNDIFDYLEYRDYLRDHYQSQKQLHHFFSFRYIAQKTGLDASFYVKILNKQKHIADTAIDALCDFLKLNKREKDYFSVLVHFNKAKRPEQERLYFEKLLSMRYPAAKLLDKDKYDYLSSWRVVAVREQLNVKPFTGNYADLATRFAPPITPAQAKHSVALLEKLGMVQRDGDGVFRVTNRFVSTDGLTRSIAVRKFQKQVGALALAALDSLPKEERDISTLTLSTSRACLDAIRERLIEVRREIMEMVRNDENVEDVYQLNFQIFPLTRNAKRREL